MCTQALESAQRLAEEKGLGDQVKEVLQVIETIDPKLKMLTELLNSDIDVNIDIKLITLLSTRTFQFFTLFAFRPWKNWR